MKILVLGDTHGSRDAIDYACRTAAAAGCEKIVQCGDFGYGWDLMESEEERFPAYVNREAAAFGLDVAWLDGNHENFDVLEQVIDLSGPAPQQMRSNLWYLGRGARWEWDGVRFMSLGGAYSIDKDHRVPGRSWWWQETIREVDVLNALAAFEASGPVDVMFTHDVPEGYFDPSHDLILEGRHGRASTQNREALRIVYEAVKPRLLVHGHYHFRYQSSNQHGQVIGLDCDGTGALSWVVLDTADWKAQAL